MKRAFSRFAMAAAQAQGHWLAFVLALAGVLVWVIAGAFVGYGNTLYELVINTATTITTFLGVFLIQHAANVSDEATHLKLDELLRAVNRADNAIIDAEDEPEDEIKEQKRAVQQRAARR